MPSVEKSNFFEAKSSICAIWRLFIVKSSFFKHVSLKFLVPWKTRFQNWFFFHVAGKRKLLVGMWLIKVVISGKCESVESNFHKSIYSKRNSSCEFFFVFLWVHDISKMDCATAETWNGWSCCQTGLIDKSASLPFWKTTLRARKEKKSI